MGKKLFVSAKLRKILLLGFVLSVIGFLALFLFLIVITRAPNREQAAEMFESVTKIYAYEVWNGTPYMLFSTGFSGQGTLYFDRLPIAKQQPHFLFLLDRQWSGSQYSIPYTDAPASLGSGHCTGFTELLPPQCTSVDIFGQINNKKIQILAVKFGDKWFQYTVSYPGFAIRINNFTGEISDYHWLDDKGQIVWTKAQDKTITFPSE